MGVHKALQILRNKVDLQHFCGYVTMLNASSQLTSRKLSDASDERGQSLFGTLDKTTGFEFNTVFMCKPQQTSVEMLSYLIVFIRR